MKGNDMHPLLQKNIEREKEHVVAFQVALKKAFDILGNVYAPIFFCAACLQGIALPILVIKSGDGINALLGARGIGVLTTESTEALWMIIISVGVFFATKFLLKKLEGKILHLFQTLAGIVYACALLVVSASSLGIFFTNVFFMSVWRIAREEKARIMIAIVWLSAITWIIFSLATDVARRVSSLGDVVSMSVISTLLFIVTTKKLFSSDTKKM